MKYRSEIDGLRAIAVISVVFFHAGLESFSGGFVGVDVFFVISGYLITSIILTEKEQGIFSLVNFYERRARRILPALFFIMLVSLLFSWLWLIPPDMKSFSQSLIAVSSFTSNVFFWFGASYWGAANELTPLLHTWSLGVEEQYYILFPLFLIFMWRYRKRWILGTLIIFAVVSLLISQWGAFNHPTANFYLLPTRGWEFVIGACIAFYFSYKPKFISIFSHYKLINETLGLFGLLMIGYAVVVFDETTPFPGFYTLIPTIGTGLIIIFSSSETFIGRLLGNKVFVGVGLISYSVYLWHQPLLAFSRHTEFAESSDFALILMVILSFPLAYLSWRFIEKPFRNKYGVNRKSIFVFSVVGSLTFVVIGIAGINTDGFEGRFSQSNLTVKMIEKKWQVNHGLSNTCDDKFTLSTDCRTSDEPEILIWGDSFAMHLVSGIVASNPDAKIIQMTKSFCGPLFDLAPVNGPVYSVNWAKGCLTFSQKVREWAKNNTSIKYAVLSSPFGQYMRENTMLLTRDGQLSRPDFLLVVKAFEKTLEELVRMGIKPIVFSPPPANGINIGRCLAKAEWNGRNLDSCNFTVENMSSERVLASSFLELIEINYPVVHLDKLICDGTLCKSHIGSFYIFRDGGHLSHEGSATLGRIHNFYNIITSS